MSKRAIKLVCGIVAVFLVFGFSSPAHADNSWTQVGFSGEKVTYVESSVDGGTVYAATQTSLSRSMDGGATWSIVTPAGAVRQLAVSTRNSKDLVAATDMGIVHSSDGGDHWIQASGPLVTSEFHVSRVVRSASDPNVAWAVSGNMLLKSADSGASWSLLTNFHPAYTYSVIAIDPKMPNVVYATDPMSLYKTVDGGLTWATISTYSLTESISSIAINPINPDEVVLSGTPKVSHSSNGGLSFQAMGNFHGWSTSNRITAGIATFDGLGGLFVSAFNQSIFPWEGVGVWQPKDSEFVAMPGPEKMYANWLVSHNSFVYAATNGGLYRYGSISTGPSTDVDPYPVIVIPGIMGSWKDHGVWRLDPITHTYDGLISALSAAGYREGTDLFEFPYEWRNSNVVTAEILKAKIEQIKTLTGQPKVNIIAHSMGGLVARQYVQGNDYGYDVNKLILIGTPNLGAPMAYLMWEGQDFSFMELKQRVALEITISAEAVASGFANVFEYVHAQVPSVQELLPIYNYIKPAETGQLKSYPMGYPTNPFIENLEISKGLLGSRVQLYSIVGDLGPESTTGIIRTSTSRPLFMEGYLWPDGYPENHNVPFTDSGLEDVNGDGTVPLVSAAHLGSDVTYQGSHGGIVSLAENKILDILGRPAGEILSSPSFPRFWILFAHSPVEVSITKGGQPVTPDFYTGPGEEPQILTIPDPQSGEYQVHLTGVGTGSYQVDSVIADDNADPSQPDPAPVSFVGKTKPGAVTDLVAQISDNVTAPALKPLDQVPPVSQVSLTGQKGSNGWYRSSVQAEISATDDLTGVDKTEYSLDGSGWSDYSTPVIISGDGTHQLRYRARDLVGNVEQEQTQEIRIDTTAPSASLKIPSFVLRYGKLTPKVKVSDATSGVTKTELWLDGSLQHKRSIELADLRLGAHALKLSVIDNAGNITDITRTFELGVNLAVVWHDARALYEKGEIKRQEYDKLSNILWRAGRDVVWNKGKQYKQDLSELQKELKNAKTRDITSHARERLLEEAQYLSGVSKV